MVNTILFDIHKNYIVTYNSRVYAVISIFQRSPWARGASVGCSTGLRYSSASGRFMHLRCVSCGKALLIYYLTIYNVQLMYYLVILYCCPLSDTRRVVSVNSRGRGFLAGKAAGARRISAENETDGGAESFLGPE